MESWPGYSHQLFVCHHEAVVAARPVACGALAVRRLASQLLGLGRGRGAGSAPGGQGGGLGQRGAGQNLPRRGLALAQMAPPGAQTCPDGAARRSNLPRQPPPKSKCHGPRCCRLSQSVGDDFQLAGTLLGALALSSYFRYTGHTVVHAG